MRAKTRKRWLIACSVVVVLVIAGLVGIAGCGEDERGDFYATTSTSPWLGAGAAFDDESSQYMGDGGMADAVEEARVPTVDDAIDYEKSTVGSSETLTPDFDQKILKEGTLTIEVEEDKFDRAYDQAQLLATHYGGFIVSSSRHSYSIGEDGETYVRGTVTVRVPVDSFERAMSEARGLGEVQGDATKTRDVTEEYVDLQAAIDNQQVYVDWLQAYLAQTKTLDDVLRVRQILANEQRVLEQLKGRMQYLEAHTSFSTLTIELYQTGAEASPPDDEEEWGFVESLKSALHNVVDVFRYVVEGLGWIVPIIIVLGIVAGIAYLVVRGGSRRSKSRSSAGKDGGKAKTS